MGRAHLRRERRQHVQIKFFLPWSIDRGCNVSSVSLLLPQQRPAVCILPSPNALSHALDMTEGQPPGHCVRCCWIGMHVGRELGLPEDQLRELYYVLLLKDLGCSSNAARICALYLTDDLAFKRDYKAVGDSLSKALGFVPSHTGLKVGLAERFRAILHIFRYGGEIARELIETRCPRCRHCPPPALS